MSADRPKAFTELVAQLEAAGWSYGVRWTRPDTGLLKLTVTGAPPWDEITRVEVVWLSRDDGALRLSSCQARQEYRGFYSLSLKAARELVVPQPAEVTS
jgi:hypothetical protein